ncbi:MAG TPA: cytochrome P460 family protein [Gammaproteobacteria bacterium]|nr:cytochrome P460 family protein [Gammaproteobacteria bacterium]
MKINRYVNAALLAVAATALSSALVFAASGRAQVADATPGSAPPVDAKGNLHVPSNYRQAYEYLGSWAIAADSGSGSKQIHEVYASPGTIEAYRKTGKFPNGTTLIKEVFATQTSPMTTGTVSRVGKLQGWFVMVRDNKDDHPGNPLWAHGWGWSWFDAGNHKKTTSTSFQANCQGCHTPARNTDWVYVQGYAPLRH